MPLNPLHSALLRILDDAAAIRSADVSGGASSSGEFVLGIALCLLGAGATNLGLTFQKLSFMRNDLLEPTKQRRAAQQPLWLFGLVVFLAGQILNLLAFGYTGQALAATLGSFSLVTNGILAPLLLGEKLTKTMVLSIGIIVFGSALVVFSSSRAAQEYTLSELIHLLHRDLFMIYISVLSVAFAISLVLMWREDRAWVVEQDRVANEKAVADGKALEWMGSPTANLLAKPSPQSIASTNPNWQKSALAGVLPPTSYGAINGAAAIQESGLELDPELAGHGVNAANFPSDSTLPATACDPAPLSWREHAPPSETMALLGSRPSPTPSPTGSDSGAGQSSVTPIVAGAILSSCSVLFGKCTIQLLKASFGPGSTADSNQFRSPLAWILTGVFLFCAIAAVVFLNIGLRRGKALFVVPLYYVLNTILAILGGLIYFEEFRAFSPARGTVFGLGVLVTIVGVWTSSRGQVATEDGGEDEDEPIYLRGEMSMHDEFEVLYPTAAEVAAAAEERAQQATAQPAEATVGAAPSAPSSTAPVTPQHTRIKSSMSPVQSVGFGLDQSGHPASVRKSSSGKRLSVRFEEAGAAPGDAHVAHEPARLSRAFSAPGAGFTPDEMRAMNTADASSLGIIDESTPTSPPLAAVHALSTPQPLPRNLDASSGFRTPGHAPRTRSLSSLTPEQQAATLRRDHQLLSAGWRRLKSKRFSYDHAAYASSFGAVVEAAQTQAAQPPLMRSLSATTSRAAAQHARHPHKPERRYSVAVIGLGIS